MDLLTGMSLFTGAGGLDLAAESKGIRTICRVEWDAYAQGVLMSRMRDGTIHPAPLWDDVSTFDGRPWCGRVDVVYGGFPCQDLSVAGKRAGISDGKRSRLWKEFARILGEVGPRYVLVENVPGLLLRGALGVVLGDLAALGFDARWQVLSAASVGAPHERERVFIVGHAPGAQRPRAWIGNTGTGGRHADLVVQANRWRTPQAHNGKQGPKSPSPHYQRCLETGESQITLVDQVNNQWMTPKANDGSKPSGGQSRFLASASGEKSKWPTPTVIDSGESHTPQQWRAKQKRLKEKNKGKNGNGIGLSLKIAVRIEDEKLADAASKRRREKRGDIK